MRDAEALAAAQGVRTHRTVALFAAAALLLLTQPLWDAATALPALDDRGISASPRVHAAVLLIVVGATALLLVAAAVAGAARSSRLLLAVDVALIVAGAALAVGALAVEPVRTDESALTSRAATALLSGQPVYGVSWPEVFADGRVPLTPTMSGGADTSYAYPPVAVLLVAAFRALVGHADAATGVVGTGGLVAAVVAGWLLVPAPWRSLVTASGLAADMLTGDARGGYPAVVALALLVPVVAGWDRTGEEGRLGPAGYLRGVALGAACATHQTAWFYAPFLAVGVWAMRRQEVGALRALGVLGRYAGVTVLAWLALDAPFLLTEPTAWLHGLALPLVQHAIVHGQGLVDVSEFLTGGSGAIGAYSVAQTLLLVGLVVLVGLAPRRLAPALGVLPALPYLLGTRSSADYLLLFAPLWIVCALTVRTAEDPPRWPLLVRTLVPVALLAPALVAAGVGMGTPPPLVVRVTHVATAHGRADSAVVTIRNRGSASLAPHFLSRAGTHPSFWWTVRSGPRVLAPGASARYVLLPDDRETARDVVERGSDTVLMTVTDDPMTLTNARFPAA